MKVVIIAGIIDRYDAVSECVLANLHAFRTIAGSYSIDIRVYCLFSSCEDSAIHALTRWQDLLTETFFVEADLVVAHFAIRSDIHHAIAFVSKRTRLVIEYYGVTPPQYLPADMTPIIAESYRQIGLLDAADGVVAHSEYLARELKDILPGVEVVVKPLFALNEAPEPLSNPFPTNGHIEVVFCGRLVASKQVVELVDALSEVSLAMTGLRLTIITSGRHSDNAYVRRLEDRIALRGDRLEVAVRYSLAASEVADLVARAHLLVLPSLHEGFGVPVAEALAAGTPVVCSNAGALPEVAGGLAATFEAGSFGALVETLEAALGARSRGFVLTDAGEAIYEDWAKKARALAARYRRTSYQEGRAEYYGRVLKTLPRPSNHIKLARRDAFQSLTSHAVEAANPLECQLLGRYVALKVARRARSDAQAALEDLQRWFSCASTSEQLLEARLPLPVHSATPDDVLRALRGLMSLEEVRRSTWGWRSAAGVFGALAEIDEPPRSDDPLEIRAEPLTKTEIVQIVGSLSGNVAFVEACYALILGRPYDRDGLMSFVQQLDGGLAREDLIDLFFQSPEFQDRLKALS